MRAAALVCLVAAAALYLPSRVDMARRNRRARLARCGWLDAQIELALEAGVIRDLGDEPTPMHDRLVCEQLESQFNGGAA
jgi:hypothetical protein